MRKLTCSTWIATAVAAVFLLAAPQVSAAPVDGAELPFPPVPSASKAGPTLQTSTHIRRAQPNHLAKDAPNVLIILIDDVGYGQASTYGGEINTPNLTRIAQATGEVGRLGGRRGVRGEADATRAEREPLALRERV